jgi:hypothetical protein
MRTVGRGRPSFGRMESETGKPLSTRNSTKRKVMGLGKDRVEMRRREGLKVPRKQRPQDRQWLNGDSWATRYSKREI